MPETPVQRRPGGRSARVREAVLKATYEVVGERGPDGLTVAEVATRAGVHETSIYRRWGTREQLMLDALLTTSSLQLPVPDTGSLRGDLVAFATSLAGYLNNPVSLALVQALAAGGDDGTAADTRREFWEARYALVAEVIERAIARGEVPESTDARLVLEAVIAPLHFRALLVRDTVDAALAERVVALVLDGVTT